MAYIAIRNDKVDVLAQDQESLLSEHDAVGPRRSQKSLRDRFIYAVCCILIITNFTALVSCFYFRDLDSICSAYTAEHGSLIRDAMAVKYVTIPLNGKFWEDSIYRDKASPIVDAAWEELAHSSDPPHIAVPLSQAKRHGLEPWQVKLDPATPGLEHTTEPHLVADVEMFHQLHCLDLVRKGSFWDYSYYQAKDMAEAAAGIRQGAFSGTDEDSHRHWSHCLDMIRQRIMCTADVELFGQVWVGDGLTIKFSGERKCRNYEEIRSWVLENRIQKNKEGKVEVQRFPEDRVFANVSEIP